MAEKSLSHGASAIQYQDGSSIKEVCKPDEPSETHNRQQSREENSRYIFKDPEQENCANIPVYDSQPQQKQMLGEGTWSNQTSRFFQVSSVVSDS